MSPLVTWFCFGSWVPWEIMTKAPWWSIVFFHRQHFSNRYNAKNIKVCEPLPHECLQKSKMLVIITPPPQNCLGTNIQMVYIPVFHFTASFQVVSLFLLKAELLLLPTQLLTLTCHALCLFTPFLKEAILIKIHRHGHYTVASSNKIT